MKFKIWDKVRIINWDYVLQEHSNVYSDKNRMVNIWKIWIIKSIEKTYEYPYQIEDCDNWCMFIEFYFDDNLELVDELKEWDIVYVSDISEEHALEQMAERLYLCTIQKWRYKYICTWNNWYYERWDDINIKTYRYIVKKPIEDIKIRKIECTDSKREEIQNILNLK